MTRAECLTGFCAHLLTRGVTGASAGAGGSAMPGALLARYKTCQWMAELPDAVCSDSAAYPCSGATLTAATPARIECDADELLRSGTMSIPAATPPRGPTATSRAIVLRCTAVSCCDPRADLPRLRRATVLRCNAVSCCDPLARIHSDLDEQLCSDVTLSPAASTTC